MARTARDRTRARVAVPVALALLMSPALAACSDDSAGPETGADIEDVVDEEPTEDVEDVLDQDVEETAEAAASEAAGPADDADGVGFQEQAGALVGQEVTVSGTVVEYVSESALRIGAETDDSLLVIGAGSTLTELGLDEAGEALVEEERILQVTGTVRRYDPEEFAAEYGEEFEGLYEEAEGENVIVASSITPITGQEVTVVGEVDDVISEAAFRLVGVGWDVVVLDAETVEEAEEDQVVEVTGTVRRFELTAIEEELGTDLEDDLYEEIEDELVLVAESIEPAEPRQ